MQVTLFNYLNLAGYLICNKVDCLFIYLTINIEKNMNTVIVILKLKSEHYQKKLKNVAFSNKKNYKFF